MNTASDIEQLDTFLRNELSAVEAYAGAIERLPMSIHRLALASCKGSHALRVTLLRRRLADLGATPSDDVSWRGLANPLDRIAPLAEQAAIEALEACEDRGHQHYRDHLSMLTVQSRPFVSRQLLPEQKRTHAMMMELRRHVLRRVRLTHSLAG